MGFIELSSTMSNDEFDIYADIDDIKLGDKIKTLQDEVAKLQEQLNEKDNQITALQAQGKKMWDTNKRLMCNISCLMKTAKLEGARKDKIIADLRKEKEDIIFRRNKNVVNQRIENKSNDQIDSIIRNKSQDENKNDKNDVQNRNKEITVPDKKKECIERKVKRKLTINNEDNNSKSSKKMKSEEVPTYDSSSTLRASENIHQINREITCKQDFVKIIPTRDNETNNTVTSITPHNNELQVVVSKEDKNSKENLHISSKTLIKGKSESSPVHKSSSSKSKRYERDETKHSSDKDKYHRDKRSRSPARKNYKHESRYRHPDNDRKSKERRKSNERTSRTDDKRKYDDRDERVRRESSKTSDKSMKSTRYHKQSCENLKNNCPDNHKEKRSTTTVDNHSKSVKNQKSKKESSKIEDSPEIASRNVSMSKDLTSNFVCGTYKSHSKYDIEYIDLYKNSEASSVEVAPEEKSLKADTKCRDDLENNKSQETDSLLDNIANNKISPLCHSQITNKSNDKNDDSSKMEKEKSEFEKIELKQIILENDDKNTNSDQKISDILSSTKQIDISPHLPELSNNDGADKEIFQDEISKHATDSLECAQTVILRILGMSRSPQKKTDNATTKKKCEPVDKELEDHVQIDEPLSSQEKIIVPEQDTTNRVNNLQEDEKSESVINSSMSTQNIIEQLLGTNEIPQKSLSYLIAEKKSEVEEDSIKAITDEIQGNSQAIRHQVDAPPETTQNNVISVNSDVQNNTSLNEILSSSTNSTEPRETSKTSLNDSGNAYTLSTDRSKYECIVDNRNCYTIKCKRVRRMKNN